jgi:serine/threonine protein kinase
MFKKKEDKYLGANVDIWALGVTMYFILTGRHPHFEADNLEDLQHKIQNVEIDFGIIKHHQTRNIVA